MMYLVLVWPETAGGWVGLALASVSIIAIIGGVIIRVGRAHIENRVTVKMQECEDSLATQIKEAVQSAIAPLERQINNGLLDRQRRIEQKIDRLSEHRYQPPWDGSERRTT